MRKHNGDGRTSPVKEEIREYIRTTFLPGKVDARFTDDDLLFESGLVDSMGAMSLIAFLAKRYKIRVRDDELFPENFASVNRISSFVERKLQQQT